MELTVFLLDDHAIFREGLKSVLNADGRFRIVGESADGLEAVKLLDKLKPRIAILDVSVPGMTGLDAASHVKKNRPETIVIMLTMHTDDDIVYEALRAGCNGYLVKRTAAKSIVPAIERCLAGDLVLDPSVSRRIADAFLHSGRPVRRAATAQAGKKPRGKIKQDISPFERLSDREREVLKLTAEGFDAKQTAAALGISVKTVETHKAGIKRKLGLKTLAEMIKYSIRSGLVDIG